MPRSLPATPTIETLKKQSKQILKAHKDGNVSCCATLKLLHRFKGKSDAEILNSALKLADAQFALAMDYGFESWAQLKKFLDSSAKVRKGVILNWKDIIGDKQNCRIEGGDLVVEDPKSECGLHVEFGGMSWDNYRLGVDVLIEKNSSSIAKFPANVQFCPRGTCVFCQIFGPGQVEWEGIKSVWEGVTLTYWNDEIKGHTGLAHVHRPLPSGVWHRFEILVQSPRVCIFVNGEEVIKKDVPLGTDGMPGLIVNYDSDARVRLRNLRIRFFKPTRLQVEEYGTDAATNWANYKRREIEAGRRKSMDDDSL